MLQARGVRAEEERRPGDDAVRSDRVVHADMVALEAPAPGPVARLPEDGGVVECSIAEVGGRELFLHVQGVIEGHHLASAGVGLPAKAAEEQAMRELLLPVRHLRKGQAGLGVWEVVPRGALGVVIER